MSAPQQWGAGLEALQRSIQNKGKLINFIVEQVKCVSSGWTIDEDAVSLFITTPDGKRYYLLVDECEDAGEIDKEDSEK